MFVEQQGFVLHLVSAQRWPLHVSLSPLIPVGPLATFLSCLLHPDHGHEQVGLISESSLITSQWSAAPLTLNSLLLVYT